MTGDCRWWTTLHTLRPVVVLASSHDRTENNSPALLHVPDFRSRAATERVGHGLQPPLMMGNRDVSDLPGQSSGKIGDSIGSWRQSCLISGDVATRRNFRYNSKNNIPHNIIVYEHRSTTAAKFQNDNIYMYFSYFIRWSLIIVVVEKKHEN